MQDLSSYYEKEIILIVSSIGSKDAENIQDTFNLVKNHC